jgi:hypothetical protein
MNKEPRSKSILPAPHAISIISLVCFSDKKVYDVETPIGERHKAAVSNADGREIGASWVITLSCKYASKTL